MSTNKLERLLKLIAVLLDTGRPLTAAELRESVEGYPEADASFHRAFERDKDELREMGVPLRIERVPGTDPPVDGYRIPGDEYYLADPGLDPEELAALHLASMAVRFGGADDSPSSADREALWKLGGQAEVVSEAGADWIASVPVDPRLTQLFSAITERAVVGFDYRHESREVEPSRLDFQRGRWYLTGHDRVREGERNFRLDRIDGMIRRLDELVPVGASTDGPGRRQTGQRLESWEMGDGEPVGIEIQVDAPLAGWARRRLPDDVQLTERDGGALRAVVPVRNEEAFRSFVLDFLEHAEIVGPPDVRERFLEWLGAMTS